MRGRRWNLLMAATLVVGVAWIWLNRAPATNRASAGLQPAPAVGHPAPDFTLSVLDGSSLNLTALRGRPVVLNFWATWCPPCRNELPQLQAASQRHAGEVAFVGVDQGEPAGQVRSFAGQMGLTYPVPLDLTGGVSRSYAVRSLPTTFFIDRTGVIRHVQIGPLTEATLADLLRTVYP